MTFTSESCWGLLGPSFVSSAVCPSVPVTLSDVVSPEPSLPRSPVW